jgi:hypothetical protein
VVDASGRYNVTRTGRLALRVQRIGDESRTQSLTFEHETRRTNATLLTIDRVVHSRGKQVFKKLEADQSNSPCANKACGASCRACDGQGPGCRETAVPKRCGAHGMCSPRQPVCEQ